MRKPSGRSGVNRPRYVGIPVLMLDRLERFVDPHLDPCGLFSELPRRAESRISPGPPLFPGASFSFRASVKNCFRVCPRSAAVEVYRVERGGLQGNVPGPCSGASGANTKRRPRVYDSSCMPACRSPSMMRKR